MSKILLFFISALFYFPINAHSTDIYQFIIWRNYIDQNKKFHTNTNDFQKFLSKNGLKPINVIYHRRFLTKGKPDPDKIKKIAELSKRLPHIPISFDIEIGNKFDPKTVLPTVTQTIDLYHQFGGSAPIGVYGILPQNVFGSEQFNENTKKQYIELNKQYESIANKVDFLSPVIYNIWFKDFNEWKRRTDHHLSEGEKYARKYNLKLIPYFSSSYLDKGFFENKIIHPLSEAEMKQRLDYIKSKNVDGIIIWDTSVGVLQNGEKPIFDANQGFGKVLLDSVKQFKE